MDWTVAASSVDVDLHGSHGKVLCLIRSLVKFERDRQQTRAYQTVCHKIHIQDTQFRSFRFIAIKSTMSAKVEILLGPWGPEKWWRGAEFGRKIENL